MAACQTRIIKDVWCLSDACCCIDETEYTADEETLPSFALHKRTQAADHAPSGDTGDTAFIKTPFSKCRLTLRYSSFFIKTYLSSGKYRNITAYRET